MNNKISAEEKHYIKLNTKLKRDYNKLNEKYDKELAYTKELHKSIDTQNKVIHNLNRVNEVLLDKLGLSKEDVDGIIRNNKTIEMMFGIIKNIGY